MIPLRTHRNRARLLATCLLAATTVPAATRADSPGADRPSTPVFRNHVVPVNGGRIDWTNGVVVAEGIGRARGVGPQQRLMARRAAELIATRNALAAAQGVRIDADSHVAGLRSGSVQIQGIVRGQQITAAEWLPDANPPHMRVRIEVPLWGVGGFGGLFWRSEQIQARYSQTPRAAFTDRSADTTIVTVVLDARGLNVTECLYPRVVDTTGRVLYDVATLPTATARQLPTVRYVESTASLERLRSHATLARPATAVVQTEPSSAGSETGAAVDATTGGTAPSTRRPFLSPDPPGKWRVVRVKKVTGPAGTTLVLAPADLDTLTRSPEAAAAFQQAHVLVVVDAE